MMSKSRIFALMLFMNTFASVCFAQSLVDVFSLRKTKPETASFQLSKHPVHYCELQRIVGLVVIALFTPATASASFSFFRRNRIFMPSEKGDFFCAGQKKFHTPCKIRAESA